MVQFFFGNVAQSVLLEELGQMTVASALEVEPFHSLGKRFEFDRIMILQQVHGANGFIIKEGQAIDGLKLRTYEGDFLVTNSKKVALGVLTADCLPLVFTDTQQEVVGIAHAGWRGSVQSIAQKTVEAMTFHFGAQPKNIKVFFGPCAKSCCYEIDLPFIEKIKDDSYAIKAVTRRGQKYYFDIPLYNLLKLKSLQIPSTSLYFDDNRCTICCPEYCSYRAQNGTQRRNISFVSLK